MYYGYTILTELELTNALELENLTQACMELEN